MKLKIWRAMKRPQTEREVPILRRACRLCEQRDAGRTGEPEIEGVLARERRFGELHLRDLMTKRRPKQPRERSAVGQPRHEHGQARIHRDGVYPSARFRRNITCLETEVRRARPFGTRDKVPSRKWPRIRARRRGVRALARPLRHKEGRWNAGDAPR